MSLLFMSLIVVGGLALTVELLNLFAKDFFGGGQAQEKIKESIRKTQSEIRAADKKLDAMRATRRGVVAEFERKVTHIEDLEKNLKRAPDLPPSLIFILGSASGTAGRYRAKISKTLPPDADEHQTLLWKHTAFVEVAAAAADEARDSARRQFPDGQGYAIGPFTAAAPSVVSAA